MTMARRVLLAITLSNLAACAAPSAPSEGASYTVGVIRGQRAVLSRESLAIELSSVDDSRCPPKVQCVQAGQVSVTLRVSQAGEASELVTLAMPGGTSRPGEGRILGYRISLQDVSPRPAEGAEEGGYRVTLKVTRDGAYTR
jgi:hypothetical protein